MKLAGYNIKDIEKDSGEMDSLLDIEEPDIKKEIKLKRKRINFNNILPIPKVDKCMGLCELESKRNPFKELY